VDPRVALEELQRREASERRRYRAIYGIDLDDLSPYHVVVDTHCWEREAVTQALYGLARALMERTG
jgi:cytidylate kinase